VLSSCTNLANVCVGGGVVAIAYGFAQAGLAFGLLLLLLSLALSLSCLYFLVRIANAYNVRTVKQAAAILLGRRWANFSEAVTVFFSAGVLTVYAILIGDYLTEFQQNYASCAPSDASQACLFSFAVPAFFASRTGLTLAAALLTLLPLSLPRSLDALRFTSALAVFAIVFALAVSGYYAFSLPQPPNPVTWLPPNGLRGVAALFPIATLAFSAALAVMALFASSRLSHSPAAFTHRVSFPTLLVVAVLYLFAAAVGLRLDGLGAPDNLLLSTRLPDTAIVKAARASMLIVILLSHPVVLASSRRATVSVALGQPTAPGLLHPAIGVLLLAVTVAIAVTFPDLGAVLGILGAIGGVGSSFLIPAALYAAHATRVRTGKPRAGSLMSLSASSQYPSPVQPRDQGKPSWALPRVVILLSTIAGAVSLWASVMDLLDGDDN
jgi:amino acid permease